MIVNCSMRHSPSGRKRKTNAYKKAKRPEFVSRTPVAQPVVNLAKTASSKTIGYTKPVDNSWKVEASKNFTVAPAYNKGAYQVIPRGDVEWIGK